MPALGGSRKVLVAGERDVILTSDLTNIALVADANTDRVMSGGIYLYSSAVQILWNPLSGVGQRLRTPSQMRGASAATADGTSIWTPNAGLRARLMGYYIVVASNSIKGVAGTLLIQITDAGANWTTGSGFRAPSHNVFIPAAAGPVGPPLLEMVVPFPGNGYLSAAANNIVTLGLTGGPLTGGGIDVFCWGTEE